MRRTRVQELLETKRPNVPVVNERVPSQNEKSGLAERSPNSMSGFHERLHRIPQETSGFGNSRKRSDCTVERRDRSSLSKAGYSERTSVFVCFALQTRTKPDEAELTLIISSNDIESARTNSISVEARPLVFPLGFVRIPS